MLFVDEERKIISQAVKVLVCNGSKCFFTPWLEFLGNSVDKSTIDSPLDEGKFTKLNLSIWMTRTSGCSKKTDSQYFGN